MKIKDIYLAEARMAPLYHATSLDNIQDILKDNMLRADTDHMMGDIFPDRIGDSRRLTGVSLTRSKAFADGWADVILVLDQQKLAHNYRMIQVNYFYDGSTADRSEAEEFAVGNIKPLEKYITGIYFSPRMEKEYLNPKELAQWNDRELANWKAVYEHPKYIGNKLRSAAPKKRLVADINEDAAIPQPITSATLYQLEQKLDTIYKQAGIDVRFTRHFLDRINDERNKTPITIRELIDAFLKTFKKYGSQLKKIKPKFEAVITDISTMLNIPFVLIWDEKNNEVDMMVKTIMRKDNFHTPDPKLKVESTLSEYELNAQQKNWPLNNKAVSIIDIDPGIFLNMTTDAQTLLAIADRALDKSAYQKFADDGDLSVHPFIVIDRDTGKIKSHEGRHRAYAAYKAGDEFIRVAVLLTRADRADRDTDIPGVWYAQYTAKSWPVRQLLAGQSMKFVERNVQAQLENN